MGQEMEDAGRVARLQCEADPKGGEGCLEVPKPKDSLTEIP